jgi:hypothetical protein
MGILPILAIVYIRTFVKEPEVWVECQKQQREQHREVRAPLVRIFRPPLVGNTLSASWWMISSFVVGRGEVQIPWSGPSASASPC